METTSPARLYSGVVGAVLVVAGIIGFFYEASFDTGDSIDTDAVFGILEVNAWHNIVHLAAGALGLLAAGSDSSARLYALGFGVIYLALAAWGWIDDTILELVPVNNEDNVLHVILGVLGVGAGLATPARPEPAAAAPPPPAPPAQ